MGKPQNWLLWQRLLTEVHQIFSHRKLFIDDVHATIHVEIRVLFVGRQLKKKRKSSVKHNPTGGIPCLPGGLIKFGVNNGGGNGM